MIVQTPRLSRPKGITRLQKRANRISCESMQGHLCLKITVAYAHVIRSPEVRLDGYTQRAFPDRSTKRSVMKVLPRRWTQKECIINADDLR